MKLHILENKMVLHHYVHTTTSTNLAGNIPDSCGDLIYPFNQTSSIFSSSIIKSPATKLSSSSFSGSKICILKVI